MSIGSEGNIVVLLDRTIGGDRDAASALLPLVYDELRKLARRKLARMPSNQTLQATALVHEAYLRLVGKKDPGWDGRGHFFAAAAQSMRNIVVERARRRARFKHGAGYKRVEFDDRLLAASAGKIDLLALDDVLKKLERLDPKKAAIVTLRYFAGMTIEEIAALFEVSARTVERDWRFIRAWLQHELGIEGEDSAPD
ncbi:MAG: sigma-70 family RNA polymerase sigma factor [Planctomycetes bacterium]|nr:sigma-70 family RNA polymerase sigma factor [Planctomycetota bacterium]